MHDVLTVEGDLHGLFCLHSIGHEQRTSHGSSHGLNGYCKIDFMAINAEKKRIWVSFGIAFETIDDRNKHANANGTMMLIL